MICPLCKFDDKYDTIRDNMFSDKFEAIEVNSTIPIYKDTIKPTKTIRMYICPDCGIVFVNW